MLIHATSRQGGKQSGYTRLAHTPRSHIWTRKPLTRVVARYRPVYFLDRGLPQMGMEDSPFPPSIYLFCILYESRDNFLSLTFSVQQTNPLSKSDSPSNMISSGMANYIEDVHRVFVNLLTLPFCSVAFCSNETVNTALQREAVHTHYSVSCS